MNVEKSATYALRVAAVTEAGRGDFSQWMRKDMPAPPITGNVYLFEPGYNRETRLSHLNLLINACNASYKIHMYGR